MEIKKVLEKYNPIFKRKKISFFIDHISQGSPKLYEVRNSLADEYGVDRDAVYVLMLDTKTGTNRTYGEAEIFDSSETAKTILPEHIQIRNASTRRKEKK